MIKISILIPTYNYLEGLIRIIETLNIGDSGLVEVLIFDDSSDEKIESYFSNSNFKGNIIYQRNTNDTGAVKNWNKLIEKSSGEYILLMHHDEFPSDENFIAQLLKLINEFTEVDIFSFKCILVSGDKTYVRSHTSSYFRKLFAVTSPEYIFKRNFLGPVSTLLIRKSIVPKFDTNLKWLVDVAFYYELLKRTKSWFFYDNIIIFSELGRGDSITSNIKDELHGIKHKEKKHLVKYYNEKIIHGSSVKHLLLDICLLFDIHIKKFFLT